MNLQKKVFNLDKAKNMFTINNAKNGDSLRNVKLRRQGTITSQKLFSISIIANP